ncbi:hypothetical protein BZA70DRAFT_288158 [Myxozyma melibiosi]|uniref:DUF1168-domain-containing protein n=1 Tax=Myxozyma melibiosi TaxID=54550 RepID=A0ABR1FA27_9ASCO
MAPPPGGVLVTNEIKARRHGSQASTTDATDDEPRPAKKSRVSTDPYDTLRAQLDTLSKRPDKPIVIPRPPSPSSLLPPPPEIVKNVQGSSAGAGSGEFHVYKQARRREMERTAIFEQQRKKDTEMAEFEEKKKQLEAMDRERTERNREKRRKRNKNNKSAAKTEKAQGQSASTEGKGDVKTEADETRQTDKTEPESSASTAAAAAAAAPVADGEINLTIVDDFDF